MSHASTAKRLLALTAALSILGCTTRPDTTAPTTPAQAPDLAAGTPAHATDPVKVPDPTPVTSKNAGEGDRGPAYQPLGPQFPTTGGTTQAAPTFTAPTAGAAPPPCPSTAAPAPATPAPGPVMPPAPPIDAASPWLPFSGCVGGIPELFVYDDAIKDVYAVPGAGAPVINPQVFSGGRILFERAGEILYWDPVRELDVQFEGVNTYGPACRPSISWDGNWMVWLAYGCAYLWWRDPVTGAAYNADLAKVNAVAHAGGGVNWARISADGRWIVFTTCSGCLFVYDVRNPSVCQITAARETGVGCATHPAISPDGSQIVWTSGPCIFRMDRLSGCVDPMPYANLALNNCAALDPQFLGLDNATIFYEAFVPPCAFRVLAYNWQTEAIRTLAILNSVTPDNTISDPRP